MRASCKYSVLRSYPSSLSQCVFAREWVDAILCGECRSRGRALLPGLSISGAVLCLIHRPMVISFPSGSGGVLFALLTTPEINRQEKVCGPKNSRHAAIDKGTLRTDSLNPFLFSKLSQVPDDQLI